MNLLFYTLQYSKKCPGRYEVFTVENEIRTLEKGKIHKTVINRIEKYLIDYALVNSNNNQSDAAEYLGIHRNTIHLKLKNTHNILFN